MAAKEPQNTEVNPVNQSKFDHGELLQPHPLTRSIFVRINTSAIFGMLANNKVRDVTEPSYTSQSQT